ncbi:MAG: PorT family protein [Acidobacteria bacterium]|nr:PorT family protein [Acidobacteriota bacterium]
MRFILALIPCIFAAQDPRFSFGFTGGLSVPSQATQRFGTYNQESRNYAVGSILQCRFTDDISVVVNPLYRRLGSSSNLDRFALFGSSNQTNDIAQRTRTNNLSIPILGRYAFRSPQQTWHPFVTTGFELSQSWNHTDSRQTIRNSETGSTTTNTYSFSHRSGFNNGVVAGAGIDRKWGQIHFTPEFHYTFQNPTNASVEGRHRVDLLVSIRF